MNVNVPLNKETKPIIFNRSIWSIVGILIIFTNPSARAGYDTRSIFKPSLTGLNSEFSFF